MIANIQKKIRLALLNADTDKVLVKLSDLDELNKHIESQNSRIGSLTKDIKHLSDRFDNLLAQSLSERPYKSLDEFA